MNKLVSAYVIVANSEDVIGRTLKWLNDNFEDIIVVKSDSTDNTDKIIDENIGHAKLYYRKMPPSFADQWQYAKSLCKNDWQLQVGGDEIIAFEKWDQLVKLYEKKNDGLVFPRYNLQKDKFHYTLHGFPDPQMRLVTKQASFEFKSAHESLICSNPVYVNNIVILHWGHIREPKYLIDKANIRVNLGQEYLKDDVIDGPKICQDNEWYVKRNSEFEKNIEELPNFLIEYMRKYE